MSNHKVKIPSVILAGDRPGGNSLARMFGIKNGVLVKILDKTCIQRVLESLDNCGKISDMTIVGSHEDSRQLGNSLQKVTRSHNCTWFPPEAGPAASAAKAISAGGEYPCLLTTGDHALLPSDTISEFLEAAGHITGDFIVGLVPYANVHKAFPESKRTLLKFREEVFCGSNLFLIKSQKGVRVLEYWQKVEALRKKPWKISRYIGIRFLFGYILGSLTLEKALKTISSNAGAKLCHTVVSNPLAAIDIDSKADYDLAVHWLTNEN
jgi:molybdopterin-guanine dinucleotide biosynthesis protein A